MNIKRIVGLLAAAFLAFAPIAWAEESSDASLPVLMPQVGQLYYAIAFSPDGEFLVASGASGVQLWDVITKRMLRWVSKEGADDVAFSPDGKMIAAVIIANNSIKIWDVESGNIKKILVGHSDSVYSIAFSPDGTTLATGSKDDTVKLWDTGSGRILKSIALGPYTPGNAVSFSPDSRLLVTGGSSEIKILDARSGRILKTLVGRFLHDLQLVNCVVFSPNGETIASASSSRTGSWEIDLWDQASGRRVRTWNAHSDWITSLVE